MIRVYYCTLRKVDLKKVFVDMEILLKVDPHPLPASPDVAGFPGQLCILHYFIETQTWKLCHWPGRSSVRRPGRHLSREIAARYTLPQAKQTDLDLQKWKWLFTREFTMEFFQIPSSPRMFAVISFIHNSSGTSVLFKARSIYPDVLVTWPV